jgi:4-aminobutyrate aminotransferase-like enzyme
VEDRDTRAPAPALAAHVVNELRRRRILLSVSGPAQNILKIRPPLCFAAEHADRLLTELDAVLSGAR